MKLSSCPARFAFSLAGSADTVGHLLLLLLLFTLIACDEDEDRFEYLKKLRALGVATNPVVIPPSTAEAPQIMTLTFHAAVPLATDVTAEPFIDEQAEFSLPVELALVPGSEAYAEFGGFRLFSVQATVPIPTADLIPIPPEPGYLRARYGMRLTSGNEEELVVGNFLVYPEGAPELAWTAPSVAISAPTTDPVSGDQDLIASITNPIGEKMRVGWYVSDGKVKNRRAIETEWETPSTGPHTVIVTVRGRDSGAFALQALDVTVQ